MMIIIKYIQVTKSAAPFGMVNMKTRYGTPKIRNHIKYVSFPLVFAMAGHL